MNGIGPCPSDEKKGGTTATIPILLVVLIRYIIQTEGVVDKTRK
jgi:hypothetical protein